MDATSIADDKSFEHWFEELFPVIHGYLARRIGAALADDLAAETFATAYRGRGDYDPARGALRPWLYGIAINLLRNHWRAEQHLPELDARLAPRQRLGVAGVLLLSPLWRPSRSLSR